MSDAEIKAFLNQCFDRNYRGTGTINVPPDFRADVWAKAWEWTVYKVAEQSCSGDAYIKITRIPSAGSRIAHAQIIGDTRDPHSVPSSSKKPKRSGGIASKQSTPSVLSPSGYHEYQVIFQFKDEAKDHPFSVSKLLVELEKAFLSPVSATPTIFIALCRNIANNLDPKKKRSKHDPGHYIRVRNSLGKQIAHQFEPGFVFTRGTTKKYEIPKNLQIIVATLDGLEDLFGLLIFGAIVNKAKMKSATQADFPLAVDYLHDEFLHLSIKDQTG